MDYDDYFCSQFDPEFSQEFDPLVYDSPEPIISDPDPISDDVTNVPIVPPIVCPEQYPFQFLNISEAKSSGQSHHFSGYIVADAHILSYLRIDKRRPLKPVPIQYFPNKSIFHYVSS